MRRPIIAANWKMQKTQAEARAFAEQLPGLLEGLDGADVVIAPPFTALAALADSLTPLGGRVQLAAQNVHSEPGGAFTGEISIPMLQDVGCVCCIVGHSERRSLFGETDDFVAAKVRALQQAGISPIVCVGESLEEREAGRTLDVIENQLAGSLSGAGEDLVVAYEPVWAIGTGKTATPELAQEVHALIRERLCGQFSAAGQEIRIQYGGSVKPENAKELLSQPDIDGALVGGASLDPASFSAIIRSSLS